MPVLAAQDARYVGVFGSIHEHRVWGDTDLHQLGKLAEVIVLASRRRDEDDVTDQGRRFEQLMGRLLRGFGAAHWTQIEAQIDRALKDIRSFFNVDQCALLTIGPGEGEATIAHLASGKMRFPLGVPANYSVAAPWVFGRLVNRPETIAFSRREDLPSDAALDRHYLENVHTNAAVYVPYAMDGLTRFIFAVVVNHDERILVAARDPTD